jgi:hypothetical protein
VHAAFRCPGRGQGGCKLRTAVEGVRAFTGLDLHELSDNGQAFGYGKST